MASKLSIVIPTYRREQVLVDTIKGLLDLPQSDEAEIILVDQSLEHQPEVGGFLNQYEKGGRITWIRLPRPSIPHAMNRGALKASGEVVLYLDDDIVPGANLLAGHLFAHQTSKGDLIAGRVRQPWHADDEHSAPFTEAKGKCVGEFMGGNFSIRRDVLLQLGGFDENFKGAAYRFEKEFANRMLDAGYSIWYEPTADICHLQHANGGTRSKGDHLTSWNPAHPVGAYYYLLISKSARNRWRQVAGRFFLSVRTRHHLRKPWYIPVTLFSEFAGMLWAIGLRLRGRRLLYRENAPS